MKGNFFLGADHTPRFEVREFEIKDLGEHDVLVENKACGVCGTDVHITAGEKGSAEVNPPVILGHEYSGVVKAVGEKVESVHVGDHVCIDPNIYCNTCEPCRLGKKQNCENLQALGVTRNGGFAEFSLVPESQLFVLKDEIPFEQGALAEPLACVLHGIELAHIKPGTSVLIIGGGAIGLLMAQAARLSGASPVIVSEPVEKRREIAKEVGVDVVIDPIHEDLSEKLKEATGKEGADVVIECIGKPGTIEQAIASAANGGQIVLFGVPAPEAVASLPLFDVYKKELSLSGSMINPNTHQQAVNLINVRALDLEPLITHSYPLEELEEAIAKQQSSDSLKVIVRPNA